MTPKNRSPIQVLDRAVWLLEAMAAADQPLSLKVLAADTELHPSTAYRILTALQCHDLVTRDEEAHYRLGPSWQRLGRQVRSQVDIRAVAKPIMNLLRDQTGETVNLTAPEGDQVVYIERAIPNRMMRVEQVIGSRAPLHVTAVGKLMLAESGAEGCRAYARRSGLPRYTPNTLTTQKALWAEVERCAAQGYARDDEEAELGVCCIGVLIRDGGGEAVAGLSLSAPRERLRAEWVALLQEAGRRLSQQIGYPG